MLSLRSTKRQAFYTLALVERKLSRVRVLFGSYYGGANFRFPDSISERFLMPLRLAANRVSVLPVRMQQFAHSATHLQRS